MKKLNLQVILLLAAASPSLALSQEYFGKFLDKVKGAFNIEAKPRPTFRLESDFIFIDPNGLQWVTPAQTEVDGASIPQPLWSFIGGPFEGEYINASVIHDHYCRTKTRTAHDTHRNFYYGMRAVGVEPWKATFMYWAVSTLGPSWKLQPRVTFLQKCEATQSGEALCTSTPQVDVEMVSSSPIDFSDPEVLALALSKATAVAKTLRTSNGKVLDISSTGKQILASTQNIESNSATYRAVFINKDFYSSAARLGLLANVDSNFDFASVQPWKSNQIPKPSETRFLTSHTMETIDSNRPFKIDERSKGLIANRVSIDSLGVNMRLYTPK